MSIVIAKPTVTLDLSGLSCPPLVGRGIVLDDLDAGQVLLLVSDCPGTPDDISAWVSVTAHQVIGTERARASARSTFARATARRQSDRGARHPRGVVPEPILEAKKLLEA